MAIYDHKRIHFYTSSILIFYSYLHKNNSFVLNIFLSVKFFVLWARFSLDLSNLWFMWKLYFSYENRINHWMKYKTYNMSSIRKNKRKTAEKGHANTKCLFSTNHELTELWFTETQFYLIKTVSLIIFNINFVLKSMICIPFFTWFFGALREVFVVFYFFRGIWG